MQKRLCLVLAVAVALIAREVKAQTCSSPRQMDGFRTCADVARAEQEGALVFYLQPAGEPVRGGLRRVSQHDRGARARQGT
jgi:hypothetical protein